MPDTSGKEQSAMQELIKEMELQLKYANGVKNHAFIRALENLIPKATSLLAKEADDKKNDAIAFGIWIHKNDWVASADNNTSDNWWYKEENDDNYLTTQQLYTLFFTNTYKQ